MNCFFHHRFFVAPERSAPLVPRFGEAPLHCSYRVSTMNCRPVSLPLTPLESMLMYLSPSNPFRINAYENDGGWLLAYLPCSQQLPPPAVENPSFQFSAHWPSSAQRGIAKFQASCAWSRRAGFNPIPHHPLARQSSDLWSVGGCSSAFHPCSSVFHPPRATRTPSHVHPICRAPRPCSRLARFTFEPGRYPCWL